MSAPTLPRRQRQAESMVRRLAHGVLVAAVRGRRGRPGGTWGEAVLAEFGETRGDREAVRWAAGGLRTVWRERRARARQLPRRVRISRRLATVAILGVPAGLVLEQSALTVYFEPSVDMAPTMRTGERFLVDKVSHRLTGLRHGDVVLGRAEKPEAEAASWTYAKRVIGLPGDLIECRDGRVFRNGGQVDEPYLPPDPAAARTGCRATTVPDGTLYLLGDARDVSQDSRHDEVFRLDDVQGRIVARVWPATG